MKAREIPYGYRSVIFLILVAILFAWAVRPYFTRRTMPALPVVDTRSQRVEAARGSSEVVAEYMVKNQGGRDLVITNAATSCGCSVASISPRVVRPGGRGLIRVKGSAPLVGEKHVSITLSTNSVSVPTLLLDLTMVGSGEVPFIAFSSNVVQFGALHPGDLNERFFVETHESKKASSWIQSVDCSLRRLKLGGGMVREDEIGNYAVMRCALA